MNGQLLKIKTCKIQQPKCFVIFIMNPFTLVAEYTISPVRLFYRPTTRLAKIACDSQANTLQ